MVSEVKDYEFSSWGEYMKQKPVPVFHVLTLQEIIERIDESRKQRDLMYELTPANQMILARRNGTFEAVMTGKGDKRQRCCQQTHLPPASTSPEDLACEERYCSKTHLGSRKGKRRFQNCPKSPPSRDYKSSSVTHKTR